MKDEALLRQYPELAHLEDAARRQVIATAMDRADNRMFPLVLVVIIAPIVVVFAPVEIWIDSAGVSRITSWSLDPSLIAFGVCIILALQGGLLWVWLRRRLIRKYIHNIVDERAIAHSPRDDERAEEGEPH